MFYLLFFSKLYWSVHVKKNNIIDSSLIYHLLLKPITAVGGGATGGDNQSHQIWYKGTKYSEQISFLSSTCSTEVHPPSHITHTLHWSNFSTSSCPLKGINHPVSAVRNHLWFYHTDCMHSFFFLLRGSLGVGCFIHNRLSGTIVNAGCQRSRWNLFTNSQLN